MRLLLCALLALCALEGCATLTAPHPPTPNSCAVWSRAAEAELSSQGVEAYVLEIRRPQGIGHQVCIFLHADGNLWCYDPALDDGYGNFGSSYNLWTTNRDPLYLAHCVSGDKPVQSAKFL